MSAVDNLVQQCIEVVGTEARGQAAVREVVTRAVRDRALGAELMPVPGVHVLHCTDALTVAHVVVPAGYRSLPHDHRMWAVVGIIRGREDNEFFRRRPGSLDAAGGRLLDEGEVLALGDEVVHAVGNPLSSKLTSAIHVYGGDLVRQPRSMWCGPDWTEEPYDAERAISTTLD